jgi:hypothetical protein
MVVEDDVGEVVDDGAGERDWREVGKREEREEW